MDPGLQPEPEEAQSLEATKALNPSPPPPLPTPQPKTHDKWQKSNCFITSLCNVIVGFILHTVIDNKLLTFLNFNPNYFWYYISVIMVKPLGQQVLPEEYIHTLKKPSNLSWEQFINMARKQFKDGQQEELNKKHEYEERTKKAMLEAEKIFQQNLKIKEEKEHQKRLAEAKRLQEEEERKQKEEQERLRREEEEHLKREEQEHLKREEEECCV